MKCRFRTRPGLFLAVAAVFQMLAFSAAMTRADVFTWSGDCGSTSWYATCIGDQCSDTHWWTYNNWGQAGCGSATFPGGADDVVLPNGAVFLYGNASIDTLDVGQSAMLTVDNYSHEFFVASGVSIAGQLAVVNGGELRAMDISIVNDGTLTIQFGGYAGGGVLACDGSVLLSGSGDLAFEGVGYVQGSGTLTIGDAQTIHGYGGFISNPVINEGTINADVANYAIRLDSQPKTNNGLMQATSGACLDIYATINQGAGGEIRAAGAGSQVRLYNGMSIVGGTLSTDASGVIDCNGQAATFNDLINTGTVKFENGATLYATGTTLTNDGELGIYYGGTYGGAHVQVASGLTWQGAGSIYFDDGDLDSTDTSGFIHAAGHTIHGGNGIIRAAITNHGTIAADRANYSLDLREKTKANDGVMEATGGSYLDLRTTVTQTPAGVIRASGSSSLVRLYNGANVIGGTLSTTDGGQFNCNAQTVTLSDLTNTGTVNFENGAVLAIDGTTLTNDGQIGIYYGGTYGGAHLRFDSDATLGGSGDVYISTGDVSTNTGIAFTQSVGHMIHGRGPLSVAMLNEGSVVADWSGQTLTINVQTPGMTQAGLLEALPGCPLVLNNASLFTQTAGQTVVDGTFAVNGGSLNLQGGVLAGSGAISGTVDNAAATVEPGTSAGTLTISGGYTQGAAGTLYIELAGTSAGQYDKLAVSGAASLGGTLHVEPIDGFVPEVGQQFTVMTFGSRTGEFASISGPGQYDVTYNATNVTLTVLSTGRPGDLNCDGAVNNFDVDPFILALISSQNGVPEAYYDVYPDCDIMLADVNTDGSITLFDVDPFVALLTGK